MDPLDDVAFLARAPNRTRALDLLASGAYSRQELRAKMDVSKATVNRLLEAFEKRSWIETDGERVEAYRATPAGTLLSEAFESVLEAAEQSRNLATVLRWLPVDELDFDPRRLARATVTLPSPGDPVASVRRVVEHMQNDAHVRLLPIGYVAESFRVNRNAVIESGQMFEAVLTTPVLKCIACTPRRKRQPRRCPTGTDGHLRGAPSATGVVAATVVALPAFALFLSPYLVQTRATYPALFWSAMAVLVFFGAWAVARVGWHYWILQSQRV